MHINSKSFAPTDYEIITPARKSGFIVSREVQIPEDVYLELSQKE
ncbi:MAG: hypothetical protein OEX81_03305 [Candidatus Pacebacteria bacterium]|nr:hypothetical protein [Candidatus Paceibacterota bacterium]